MDQAAKMEEYFDLSRYGSTETGEDPDDETDYYYTRERYWYHPNYLEGRGKEIYPVNKFPEEPACRDGDMITNDNGHIHQYFVYSPFGENMYQYNRNSDFNSRYRFNGKELDPETGNGYYGARYYDPKISVWLSVDPLFSRDPQLMPYHFVKNNPIIFIDPKGLTSYEVGRDGKVEKVDDQRYVRNEKGEVCSVNSNYEKKEGEEFVNEFTGTDQWGKKKVTYLQVKKQRSLMVNGHDSRNDRTEQRKLDRYYSGGHEDAVSFIEFMDEVTTKEFCYNYSKTGNLEYFEIGSFREEGESSSLMSGETLIYQLHNHPGDGGPSKEDADVAINHFPEAHREIYSVSGFTRYWPHLKQDTSPIPQAGPYQKSTYNYVKE